MTGSVTGAVFLSASAGPFVWPHLTWPAIQLSVVATPTPAPGASAQPIIARHGGPVTLSLTGSLTLGERMAADTKSVSSNQQSTGNVGMLAELARRTGSTSLRLSVPAGLSGRLANFGEMQAEYSTPKYALGYGSQSVSALGGLPLGATIRGVTLTLPLPSGDVSFYGGPSFGNNGQLLRVSGMRARTLVHGQLVELGYANAVAPDSSASIRSLIFGLAATSNKFNVLFEGAMQQSKVDGGAMTPMKPSFSVRADYGSGDTYGTATVRHIADTFVGLGSGSVQSEDFTSIGLRHQSGADAYSVDEGLGRSGTGFAEQSQRRGSFTFTHNSLRSNSTYQLSVVDQRIGSNGGVTWAGGLGLDAGFTLKRTTALMLLQAQRATSTFGDPVSTLQYGLQVQRPVGLAQLQAGYQFARQSTSGLRTSNSTYTMILSRIFGPTALSLGMTYTRAQLPLSDTTVFTPLVQISRRISPSVTLGMYAGEQITRDRINPAYNGHSRVFSVTVSSPFTFGSGHVNGAANPRLPAIISGTVLKDETPFSSSSAAISAGLANVVVVLDNRESQRTDLSGHFQFQFVPAGRHEVRLEPASLPRGVTADQAFTSLEVGGGQEGQVFFRVGAFGAVQGHVYGRDPDGNLQPLDGVALQIDDSQNALTSAFGAFGFGRLTAGQHVVKVVVNSLPANVFFGSAPVRTVTVRTGEITPLEFVADPLASIAGHVTFAQGLTGHEGGVVNAYVVANPGDHAAITNDDGSYILDNLPAGAYTISVDPETLPEETGVVSPDVNVDLKAAEHHEGVDFSVGHKTKAVVFSLHQDEAPATMTLTHPVLPPLGATQVRVEAPFDATSVKVTGFGKTVSLSPDHGSKRIWTGMFVVPGTTPAGTAELNAEVAGARHTEATAGLKIDNTMSLATVTLDPTHPARGQYVHVRVRFLADIKAGDTVLWQDGSRTRLDNPVAGRVFQFTVKITLYPYRGFLLIDGSKLPIILK